MAADWGHENCWGYSTPSRFVSDTGAGADDLVHKFAPAKRLAFPQHLESWIVPVRNGASHTARGHRVGMDDLADLARGAHLANRILGD